MFLHLVKNYVQILNLISKFLFKISQHPNLAILIEYFQKFSQLYSIYEYPKGLNLNQYIKAYGKTYEDFAISIVR